MRRIRRAAFLFGGEDSHRAFWPEGTLQMKPMGVVILLLCLGTLFAGSAWSGEGLLKAGSHMVTGGASFSSGGSIYYEDADKNRTQEWTFRPSGGVFVFDQVAFNFQIMGRWFIQGDIRQSEYAMGPAAEYYFNTVDEGDDPKGYLIPYLGLAYLWGKATDKGPDHEIKHNSGMMSYTAGFSWMLSNTVATDIAINFQDGRFTEKQPEHSVNRPATRWSIVWGVKAFLR